MYGISRFNGEIILKIEFFFIITASALRCHYCSSDSSSGAYCNDPFDENTIPAESKRFSFVECVRPSDYIVQNGGRSVCQKIKDRGE